MFVYVIDVSMHVSVLVYACERLKNKKKQSIIDVVHNYFDFNNIYILTLLQNNQGVPSIEILNQLHSPPIPYFSQASTNPMFTSGPPQGCPASAIPSTHMVPSRPSLPQEMPSACSGMSQHPIPSTNMPLGPLHYAAAPRPTLETTFGMYFLIVASFNLCLLKLNSILNI